ncbi:MAG TPA: DUF1572 family protein [Thermoanaerobaculia bacterium]|nr:DUF1572 family protein [Thermoanaerobaculia bacterium]
MDGTAYLDECRHNFRTYRDLADRAIAQVPPAKWFAEPAPGSNSLAVVMKHVGGNLRSRWTDFLTTDGEKPDRRRDGEFESGGDGESSIREIWSRGWDALFGTIDALRESDLARAVRIRGESMTVVQAMQRSIAHTASHVGQIVYVAKLRAADAWNTLSIPRGRSEEFNRAPTPYVTKP